MTTHVYLIGFMSEMGMSDNECRSLLKDRGIIMTQFEIRKARELFTATLPGAVRALLCRYTLTLSNQFREIIRPCARLRRHPINYPDARWGGRRFASYTSKLRALDGRQKLILLDEMHSSLIIDGTCWMHATVTFETLLFIWLRDTKPVLSPDLYQFTLRDYLERILGVNEHFEDYRQFLINQCGAEDIRAVNRVDRQIIPAIIDYIRWLQEFNPIDQHIIQEQ